ncbi:MAG: alanine--tRNA ligase, partial [Fibrobacteres bacterium]|nr:alanine--tRNA ligase [Fibrobacterota bacterium]
KRIIETEEKSFERTLDKGLSLFDEAASAAKKANSKIINGATVFKLYDTYGFPYDLTAQLADENGLTLDKDGFDSEMNAQKSRARAASKFKDMTAASADWVTLSEGVSSQFTGYDSIEESCTVRRIRKSTKGYDIILDKTPFYAESGGQCGDTGTIFLGEAGTVEISDTVKEGAEIVHCGTFEGDIDFTAINETTARIDEKRRADIRRNHTATHIIQYALRRVLGDHVKQSGSMNSADRLRFDFTHFQAATEEEVAAAERIANELVLANLPVTTKVASIKEAESMGALALFGEKYGDSVRVVSVGTDSIELCGGTHVTSTGEIGYIHIVFETSVSAGIRRVEAVSGRAFGELFRSQQPVVKTLCRTFKVTYDRLPEQIASQSEKIRTLEKDNGTLKTKLAMGNIDEIVAAAGTVNGVKIAKEFIIDCDRASLEAKGTSIVSKMGSGVALLFAGVDGKGAILAAVSEDLIKERKLNAGGFVKTLSEAAGGKGGGRPNLAQGGAKDIDSLKSVYDRLDSLLIGIIK